MADHFVHVPGGPNNHNYANVDLIGMSPILSSCPLLFLEFVYTWFVDTAHLFIWMYVLYIHIS